MYAETTSSYMDIDLHLREIKYMFVDPELNPFEEQRLQISGAEEAANFLRTKGRTIGNIRLNIFLPQGQIKPNLQSKTADALSKYCDFKILQNLRLLEIERATGLRAVRIGGLIFFVICLIVLSVVYLLGPLSENLLVFSEIFFTILIWMAMWNALDAFLYGLYPYKMEIKAYEALKNAEIVIIEET